MGKIKYGMIGCGNMARGHLGSINKIEDIDLVACADPFDGSIEEFRRENPNERTRYFSSHEELLEQDDIDAVVIATPNCTHAQIISDALAAGKHVLTEKPLGINHKQLSAIEDDVRKSDRIFQVGLECRYLPVFQRMSGMIESGRIGLPRMIWCKEFRGPFLEKVGNWIMFKEKSGGAFVDKMCHYFDLVTWFSRSIPRRVIALAGQDVVKDIYGVQPDIYDNGWVIIEYENNVRASLGLCMFCKASVDVEVGVIGDKAQMEGFFMDRRIKFRDYATGSVSDIDTRGSDPEIEKLSHRGGVFYEHLAFIDNIRDNKTPLTDFNVGKWSVLVSLAVEESAANNGMAITF
ncbi:MAG: Gfo/Idh/MocA family oxidoreductase [Victivallales bacterium]|nr:Gfo/Idh/MocA family oxidoreductase [Victivallales bacterium]